MDPKIEEAIKFVHAYAPAIAEWKILKKELLKLLHPTERKLLSTRDKKTKILNHNELELEIIARWKELTGTDLYLGKS